ncbi:MAG TPA: glutathione S-transferase family protein [Steroidobacteraceae bacterium]
MYTLYYAPGSASLAVHWMLIELAIPHELALVDLATKAQKDARYLKLNPNGMVPTLIVDGEPRYECAALLLFLAERHDPTGLMPPQDSPARSAYYQWMLHLANTLHPLYRRWFYAAEVALAQNAPAVLEQARIGIEAAWDRIDAQLAQGGPFILGRQFTAVDYFATMLARWSRNMPKPATQWPHVRAYIDLMRQRPGLKEVHAREGLTDWIST